MDDLIYILFGIAWIAVAIYRYNQKKKAGTSPQPQPYEEPEDEPKRFRDAGEILEELLLNNQAEPNPDPFYQELEPPTPKPIEEFQPAGDTYSFENEYDRLGIQSIEEVTLEPDIRTKEFDADSPILLEDITNEENRTEKPFHIDIKKAVIYSEILNRPHF